MPGVVISTAVRTGPSSATVRESSQLFVVGTASKGTTAAAVLIESLEQFENEFGGFLSTSYLHPTVETFFEEGGTRCYVSRAIGAGATTATKVLNTGSASAALTLTANGPGVWANGAASGLSVKVTQPSAGSNFSIQLFLNQVLVYTTGTCTSVNQAAGRINTSAIASIYMSAAVIAPYGSATTLTIVSSFSNFAGGADGAAVGDAEFTAALGYFNGALGTGVVCVPDSDAQAVQEEIITHCNTNSRVAVLHTPDGDDSDDALTLASALQGNDHAEHAALYFPWIEIPSGVNGIVRTIPPDGYVAAKRAVAHNQSGSHVPAAGLLSASRFVLGVAEDINKASGDLLDAGSVNAIRIIQNSVRIYGARSLSSDIENFRYITSQDTVNHIVVEAGRTLEDLVFSSIDGRNTIFSSIESRLIAILAPLRDVGALYESFDANGRKIDPGYAVRCDAGLNPTSQLADGLIKAKVGVRTSTVGDKIEIDIVKSNLTASVV